MDNYKEIEINVAIIGGGRAGMIHARNFATGRVAGARLVAVAEPMEQTLRGALAELRLSRGHTDYRQVIDDPSIDAVVIATPSAYHCEIAVAAAGAGKHILCEKPMAMTVGECDQMIAAVARARVKLQIGFMRRYDADFMAAKARVDAGEIGRVIMVQSHTYGPSTPQPWMYDIKKSNGPLSEVNSHDIDTVRWFAGSEFTEVYAVAGNYRSPAAREKFPDFYDNVIVAARLENQAQGSIAGAQGVQYGYDARCEILGEKGLISVGSLAGNRLAAYTASGGVTPVIHSWMNLFLDAYRAEDQDFIDCLREDRTPRAGGMDGRAAVLVVNAGNRSIVERRPVALSQEIHA